ncbi:MAG: BatA and WFA domain-containing protein [Polyangiaceae bacterium]
MTFLTAVALGVALLVVAPYVAHRLRRRRADVQPFPPARLLSASLPTVRRRSRIEDPGLFAVRAASIVVLAVLGATPFVRCTRLSLARPGGASVALVLVIDDSMSMRARADGGKSRFERAREAAGELLGSAREGDAVAVVLAGTPVRLALAATTDLDTARKAVAETEPSDRATDLDGALSVATELVTPLPQVEKRIVVFSDLADGRLDARPLGEASAVPVWVALPELREAASDCALMAADRVGTSVRVEVACGPGASAEGREVVLEDSQGKDAGRATVSGKGTHMTLAVRIADDARGPAAARLAGVDAISSDDIAPVLSEPARMAVVVVADTADEMPVTGGAPIAEQALMALKIDADVRPMPAFPDRVEDLAGALGVLLDDPPGLTPEQRRALAAFVGQGGVVLVALGPRAAAAPLGASFEPVLRSAVSWRETTSPGADTSRATGVLVADAQSLADLGAFRRAELSPADVAGLDVLAPWTDGMPLVARRVTGRGEAWIVTLPFALDASELPLRPGFLALLDGWVRAARRHGVDRRVTVGTFWTFPGADPVDVRGPRGRLAGLRTDGKWRFDPAEIGTYAVAIDGKTETRVAAPDPRELDLRPRAAAPEAIGSRVGQRTAAVDTSPGLALLLLALWTAEIALRAWSRRTGT